MLNCVSCLEKRAHVPMYLAYSHGHLSTCLACQISNLLLSFKCLISVFTQYREFIYNPSLLISCSLKMREYNKTLVNCWDLLVSEKQLFQLRDVWSKKALVKCIMYIGIIYNFHQCWYNSTNTFGNSYINSKLQAVNGD